MAWILFFLIMKKEGVEIAENVSDKLKKHKNQIIENDFIYELTCVFYFRYIFTLDNLNY